MDVVRTPDERFDGLAGWTYAPRYTNLDAADGSVSYTHLTLPTKA